MKTFSHCVHVNVGFIRTNAVFCTKTSGEKMSDFGENYIYGYGFLSFFCRGYLKILENKT